jgi:thiamine-phosphate pyrophosphorylase
VTGSFPSLLVVTDRRQARAPLPEVVAAAVAGGARWVLLREKDLPRCERAALAAQLRHVLAPVGGRLVVAGPDPLGGDAVHLAAADPLPGVALLVGRSCHDATELARLTTEDYVTLSPVYPSASKPGYGPPLGPDGLAQLRRLAGRPVLALGGVETPQRAAACRAAGAAGVAVMGAVMRADDPAAVVAALRQAVEETNMTVM